MTSEITNWKNTAQNWKVVSECYAFVPTLNIKIKDVLTLIQSLLNVQYWETTTATKNTFANFSISPNSHLHTKY